MFKLPGNDVHSMTSTCFSGLYVRRGWSGDSPNDTSEIEVSEL